MLRGRSLCDCDQNIFANFSNNKNIFKKISEMSYIKIYKERNSCDLLSTGLARGPLEQTRLCLGPK